MFDEKLHNEWYSKELLTALFKLASVCQQNKYLNLHLDKQIIFAWL